MTLSLDFFLKTSFEEIY